MVKKNNNIWIIAAVIIGFFLLSGKGGFMGAMSSSSTVTRSIQAVGTDNGVLLVNTPTFEIKYIVSGVSDKYVATIEESYTGCTAERNRVVLGSPEISSFTVYPMTTLSTTSSTICTIRGTYQFGNLGIMSMPDVSVRKCDATKYLPLASEICLNTQFEQENECKESKQASGTMACSTPCTITSWEPLKNPADECTTTTITEKSNCGTTRDEMKGTKDCTVTPPPVVNPPAGNQTGADEEKLECQFWEKEVKEEGKETKCELNTSMLVIAFIALIALRMIGG